MTIYFQSIFLLTHLSPTPVLVVCSILYVWHILTIKVGVRFRLNLTNIKNVVQARC